MSGVSVFNLLGKLAIDGVDETKKALDDVAKEGEKAKNKLTVSFNDIATKAGDMGKKMALGLAGVATAAVATVEGTREFRQDLGKLETTFETTNQASGAAMDTFKTLFGVLGEDDTAIETANHLAMLTNNEKDLNQWTDVLTGVYATFGDSLPLEGLAEAANETMRVGQVTGPLADALNWAGVSEDEFNAKLLECTSNQEREALIRETLNDLYGDASAGYKETNKSVIENNKAQAEMNLKMAETAEKLEPMITQGKLLIAEVLTKLQPFISWAIDNINILAPIVIGFMTTLFALNIASKIMSLIPIITSLNAVMMANPVALIIVGIVALIAAVVLLWNKCEWFRDLVKGLFEALKTIVSTAIEVIKNVIMIVFNAIKTYFTTVFNIYKTIFTTVFNVLKTIVTTVIEVIRTVITTVFNAIKTYFTTVFNIYKTIFTTVFNAIKTVVTTVVNTIKKVITTVFNAIKNTVTNIFNAIKNTISSVINGIRNTISSVFNGIKNTVTKVWNGIYTAIKTPFEKAKNLVKNVIDSIKGFFNFKFKWPELKMPKFSITPSGWKVGDLLKGSIPKLGIKWNAEGAIFDKPTIFNTQYGLQGVGEAGAEAVAPIDKLMGYTRQAVNESNNGLENKIDTLIYILKNYLPELAKVKVVRLSTGELVGALVDPMDKALAEKATDRKRGR